MTTKIESMLTEADIMEIFRVIIPPFVCGWWEWRPSEVIYGSQRQCLHSTPLTSPTHLATVFPGHLLCGPYCSVSSPLTYEQEPGKVQPTEIQQWEVRRLCTGEEYPQGRRHRGKGTLQGRELQGGLGEVLGLSPMTHEKQQPFKKSPS